ncbi:MAG TPA: hypothetical protein VJR89_26425 [Polyangiales bacterium]|nr:hypothetical protein [Polyangiales bacterium]
MRMGESGFGGGRPVRDSGAPEDGGAADGGGATDGGTATDAGPLACQTTCENEHGAAECSGESCEVTCSIGYGDCDTTVSNGCETSIMDDPRSCGACGSSCENPNGSTVCSEGLCTPSCASGFADCDGDAKNGCETDLGTVNACGACDRVCQNPHGTASCSAGSCSVSCAAGWGDCDGLAANGCETNLSRDPQHCGMCTRACAAGSQVCDAGSCQLSMCPAGQGECDSDLGTVCETDLTSGVGNCGFCGNTCTIANGSAACSASSCIVAGCNGGYDDCNGLPGDGCEVRLATSTSHCGACGEACSNAHGTTSCAAGSCAPLCSSGWGDCDTDTKNGCETALNTVGNCGMCGRICPANGGTAVCSSGVCTTVCDITGSFALKLNVPTSWNSIMYIRAGSGTAVAWAKLQIVQSGTALTGMLIPCGHSMPPQDQTLGERYGLTYPTATFDRTPSLPSTSFSGSLGGTAPGSSFAVGRAAFMVGAQLNDPLNDAWPNASSIQTVDVDADGKRGMTVPYRNGGGYSYPPVNSFGTARASAAYDAFRIVFSLNGTLSSCTQASGGGTAQDIEYQLLGCRISGASRDCDSGELNHMLSNSPNFTTSSVSYSMTKVADSATCADVRSALP